MNDFCLSCVANDIEEIKKCTDRNCPFWRYRRSNLSYQVKKRRKKEVKLQIPFDGSIA